jgi:hypothetical protein
MKLFKKKLNNIQMYIKITNKNNLSFDIVIEERSMYLQSY